MNILVIEDDYEIRSSLCEMLEMEGHEVTCTENGRKGLDYLNQTSILPKLILLDMMMPVMDGIEFRNLQLKDSRLSQIPTVLLSAASQLEKKAKDAGFLEFVAKPIDLDKLLAFIDKYRST